MRFHRMLIQGTGRTFIQDKPGQTIDTQFGQVQGKDIDATKDGELVESNTGEKFIVYTPAFIDAYKRIKRDAQIITFKDAGVILATAGLGPDNVVAEAGSGSGAMTAFLARHCKHVYSYDIKKEHLAVAKQNCDDLELHNVTFREHDITTGMHEEEEQVDALLLDMPEPWHVFDKLTNIKIGGYIVTYTPSVVQLQKVRNEADRAGLMHVRNVEVTERHWMVRDDAVRPTSRNTAFTAFLCFFRYFGNHWKEIIPKPKPKSQGPALPSQQIMQEVFD